MQSPPLVPQPPPNTHCMPAPADGVFPVGPPPCTVRNSVHVRLAAGLRPRLQGLGRQERAQGESPGVRHLPRAGVLGGTPVVSNPQQLSCPCFPDRDTPRHRVQGHTVVSLPDSLPHPSQSPMGWWAGNTAVTSLVTAWQPWVVTTLLESQGASPPGESWGVAQLQGDPPKLWVHNHRLVAGWAGSTELARGSWAHAIPGQVGRCHP